MLVAVLTDANHGNLVGFLNHKRLQKAHDRRSEM